VGELDGDLLVLGVCELSEGAQAGDVCVGPDSRVFGGDPAAGLDRGGFNDGEAGLRGC